MAIIKYLINKIRWKRKNKHNDTFVYAAGRDSTLTIGSYCSIAPKVSFVFNNEHNTNTFSTFPFKVMALNHDGPEAFSKGGIKVGDDVWIGFGATILDGVKIGNGAVIGAGAVVAKDIPPYAIAVGVPATVIRYRFDLELREKLLGVNHSDIDRRFIAENIDRLYEPLDDEVLRILIDRLKED